VLFTVLAAACLLCASAGCSREPEEAQAGLDPQQVRFVTEFFDGEQLLSPVQWAGVPPPEVEEGSPALLLSLHLEEVSAKRSLMGGSGVDNGNAVRAEVTAHFIHDLSILRELGRAGRLPLTWTETQREGRVIYRDDIVLPDGRRIKGLDLMMYFASIMTVARDGRLQEHEAKYHLSDSLLMIGYNIYNSDSRIGSASIRLQILPLVWHAAFALRQQRALALGNDAEAERWARHSRDLVDLQRLLARAHIQKLEGR
jgi:hypothetical protein